jgi:hypothetical protein
MSARNRKGICAYCGRERKLTRDHVPPRVLFSKPFPHDMLTVPACDECNHSFKRDDEYTATVIGLDVRAAPHRDVIGKMSEMARSLQYPEARGLAKYLASHTEPSPILGVNGAHIGKLTQDLRRINATGERIIRGLYYVERRRPVAPDARILIESRNNIELSDEILLLAVQAYEASKDRSTREVGKAFSYAVGFDNDRSVWVLMVYGYFFWFATVGDDPYENESGGQRAEIRSLSELGAATEP